MQTKDQSSPVDDQQQQSSKKKPAGFVLGQSEGTDVTHSSLQTEPIQNQQYVLNEHLFLLNFKTLECTNKSQHNYKTCLYFHNLKDKRRINCFYSADLCFFAEKDQVELCPLGDDCPKSHNRLEQLYRPDKYKKKFCSYYPYNLANCEYGKYCSFAHSESEILIDLIHNYEYDEDFYIFHYKTVWCPFNFSQHDKVLCVYAHNWQDYRRKPHLKNYEPYLCLNWKSKDIILNYEDGGCPNNENCNRCHGWKENEYHPLNYKVKPCSNGINCNKGSLCPYFHTFKDRRIISNNVQSKFFRFLPRNRIVSNTFKVRTSFATPKIPISVSPSKNTPKNSFLKTVQEEKQDLSNQLLQFYEKNNMKVIVNEYGKPTVRKTVEERPHKRLSFMDEESLRRASDSRVSEPAVFDPKNYNYSNSQYLYPQNIYSYDNYNYPFTKNKIIGNNEEFKEEL